MDNKYSLAEGEEILHYIPQRQPFVMIDRLISVDENTIRTGFQPGPQTVFSIGGIFTEPGIMENMAQSAAAGTGYACIRDNKKVPVGFIGAIKDFHLFRLPVLGETLITEVSIVAEVMNASVVRAQVTANGAMVATCEMKIFLMDEGMKNAG